MAMIFTTSSLLYFSLALLLCVSTVSACECQIANCSECTPDCLNCTKCNSTAPFLNLYVGDLNIQNPIGNLCTTNCTTAEGFYVPGTNYCIIDKTCPSTARYAYRRSDNTDTQISCNLTCAVSEGYRDDTFNCYYGILSTNA